MTCLEDFFSFHLSIISLGNCPQPGVLTGTHLFSQRAGKMTNDGTLSLIFMNWFKDWRRGGEGTQSKRVILSLSMGYDT
jgi:hypothetical protein